MCKVQHESIVQFYGSYVQSDVLHLVTEFLELGSLETVLKEESKELSWTLRVKMGWDASRALAYLHHTFFPPLIHRDLKSSNLLVNSLDYNSLTTIKVFSYFTLFHSFLLFFTLFHSFFFQLFNNSLTAIKNKAM